MPAEQLNICDTIQPWLAGYALGEPSDDAEAQAHLAQCPGCQQSLREYQQVAGMLPYSAPLVAPPPALRARVIAEIQRQSSGADAVPVAPAPAAKPLPARQPPRRTRSFWAAWAFAALALALLGWNINLQQQLGTSTAQVLTNRQSWQTMIALLNDPALQWYAVAGDSANGHFWTTGQGEDACLIAQKLPALPAGKVYQVWLTKPNQQQQTSGGTFEVRNGNAWKLITAGAPMNEYRSVFVTVEPSGGSPAPTGQQVMAGELANPSTRASADMQELLQVLWQAQQRKD